MIIVKSKNNVPIRINHERLDHIFKRHPEMNPYEELIIKTIGEPDFIQQGDFGEVLAVLETKFNTPAKYIVVIYKETNETDGFLMTAYFTRRCSDRRKILWKR